jgi:hypothetical protein
VSKDFIVVNSWIYHDMPKPAKHLSEGDHILFGGKVWMVVDAKFKDEAKYPNDLQVDLVTVAKNTADLLEKQEQSITVDRDFEVQPLIIAVLPARTDRDEKEDVDAATAQG